VGVTDLKTTKNASPEAFAWQALRLGYHVQAGLYLAILDALAPAARVWQWIVVESKPPHAVAVYQAPEAVVEDGRIRAVQALKRWKQCEESGLWPSYPAEVQMLEWPHKRLLSEWSLVEEEDE